MLAQRPAAAVGIVISASGNAIFVVLTSGNTVISAKVDIESIRPTLDIETTFCGFLEQPEFILVMTVVFQSVIRSSFI